MKNAKKAIYIAIFSLIFIILGTIKSNAGSLYLNDLKFEDAEGIFEMYPDLFMNFPKKFEEKILKLKDQLGENYVEIIENDTSVLENII